MNDMKSRGVQDVLIFCTDNFTGLNEAINACYPNAEIGFKNLAEFGEKWDNKYSYIAKSWIDNWAELSTFWKYPEEIRRLIYMTTPNGRLVFGIFAALAEFERELIIERTKAGLKAARARGRMGGRPRKMNASALRIAIAAMSDPKSIASEVAKKLNITTATLYSYVNGDGSLKQRGQMLMSGN